MAPGMQKKLDMALDDLVERCSAGVGGRDDDGARGGKGTRRRSDDDYGADRRPHGRDSKGGPYERRDGKGGKGGKGDKGKSKGRRMPAEEKALINSTYYFNEEGDFVVQLYKTPVFTLRKRPEVAVGAVIKPATISAEAKPNEDDGGAKVTPAANGEDAEKKPDDECKPSSGGGEAGDSKSAESVDKPADADSTSADVEAKPAADASTQQPADANAKPADADVKPADAADAKLAASPGGGVSIILRTGGHKTSETRYIINEACHVPGIRITEGTSGDWTVGGPSIDTRPFEDGMELCVRDSSLRASAVKEHLATKIGLAKDWEQTMRRHEGQQGRSHFDHRHGHPAHHPPHHHAPLIYHPAYPPPHPAYGYHPAYPPGVHPPGHRPQAAYQTAYPQAVATHPAYPGVAVAAPPGQQGGGSGGGSVPQPALAAAAPARGPLPDSMFQ